MPQITIQSIPNNDHPVKIHYTSTTLMTEINPQSRSEIVEAINRMEDEYATMLFVVGTKRLIIRLAIEYRYKDKIFRRQVVYEDDTLRQQSILSMEESMDSIKHNSIMDVILANTFRGNEVKRFLKSQTVSANFAANIAWYFVENQNIPVNKKWEHKIFSLVEWLQASAIVEYDTPSRYVYEYTPTRGKLIERLREMDGLSHRAMHLTTTYGRLHIFSIVELLGKDIYEPDFKRDRLRFTYKYESGRWILIDPQMYHENNEYKTSFILENGQWDPAESYEAVSKVHAETLVSKFFSTGRILNNQIWMRGGYLKLSTNMVMRYYQNKKRIDIASPTAQDIQHQIMSLNGIDRYRLIIKSEGTYLFIHITNINRVVFSFFQSEANGCLRRDRLIEKTNKLDDTRTLVLYSSEYQESIPYFETVSKETAIELATIFLQQGCWEDKPYSTESLNHWWSVQWRGYE